MHFTLGPASAITPAGCKQYTLEIDGKPRELFVVEQRGRYHAYANRCPHLGVPLNWQPDVFLNVDHTHIQCSTHGAQFRIDNGLCEWGPCLGQSLQKLDLKIDGGLLVLSLS